MIGRRPAGLGLRGGFGRLLGVSWGDSLAMLGRVPARVAVPVRVGACDRRCGSVTVLVAERLALGRLGRGDRRCRGRSGNRDLHRRRRGGANNPRTRWYARARVMSSMRPGSRGARSRHRRLRDEDLLCGSDRTRSSRRSLPRFRSRQVRRNASSRAPERGQQRYRPALHPRAREQEQRKRKADRRTKGENGW